MARKVQRFYNIEETNGNNVIDVELYYSLGGMNYFTYKQEPRGFYVSITPEHRSKGMVSYVGFSGVKKLIKEVKRYSAKSFKEAREMLPGEIENFVKPWCASKGYDIENCAYKEYDYEARR